MENSLYWDVPRVEIGPRVLPRLFLGDNGFLAKFGSKLSDTEVEERMRFASRRASLGLAAGEERCLKAAYQVRTNQNNSDRTPILYHADLSFRVNNKPTEFRRCAASLLRWLMKANPAFIEQDPVLGHFLAKYEPYAAYTEDELRGISIDHLAWQEQLRLLSQYRPDAVSVGGDYLEFALVADRLDLVEEGLNLFHEQCLRLSMPLVFTTYVGPYIWRDSAGLPTIADALLLPVNARGLAMLPNRDDLLTWAGAVNKPVIGMHTLGSGHVPLEEALSYTFTEADIPVSVIGASSYEHIDVLLTTAQALLGKQVSH